MTTISALLLCVASMSIVIACLVAYSDYLMKSRDSYRNEMNEWVKMYFEHQERNGGTGLKDALVEIRRTGNMNPPCE